MYVGPNAPSPRDISDHCIVSISTSGGLKGLLAVDGFEVSEMTTGKWICWSLRRGERRTLCKIQKKTFGGMVTEVS